MDFTRVGLYFASEAPQRAPSGVMLGNEDLRIPPDRTEKVIRDQITLAAPFEVREIRPNLLLFGRGIRAWAEQPDGRRIPLLEIPDWDFTWQETYRFAQPFLLPKGTRVQVEWTIVNDAKHELRAGDTPESEAPGLWIGGVAGSWADHIALAGANLRHYTDLVKAARARK